MRLINIILALSAAILLLVIHRVSSAPPRSERAGGANDPICEVENTTSKTVIHSVIFAPKSDRLILGGGDFMGPGEVLFAETATLKTLKIMKDHKRAIWSLAASPDGSQIATGGGFGEIKLYDAESGQVLAHLDAGGEYTDSLAFSSDGRLLAHGAWGATVKIWDMKTMKELVKVPGVKTVPHGLAFSPDDKLLAFGDRDEIRFWDVAKQEDAFRVPYKHVCSMLFTPHGKGLIVGGVDRDKPSLIRVWDLEKKKETRVFKAREPIAEGAREQAVVSLILDKEGKYLISGSGDETVRIWELASGKELVCLTGNKAIVRALAVSKDNKYLVACSDKLIRVWDLQKLLKNVVAEKEGKKD